MTPYYCHLAALLIRQRAWRKCISLMVQDYSQGREFPLPWTQPTMRSLGCNRNNDDNEKTASLLLATHLDQQVYQPTIYGIHTKLTKCKIWTAQCTIAEYVQRTSQIGTASGTKQPSATASEAITVANAKIKMYLIVYTFMHPNSYSRQWNPISAAMGIR